jgi:heterotetrameric sarcosine oxidase alpha subunit
VSRVVRQGSRLAPGSVAFRFDGRDYLGQRGDSAASALLANGQRLIGRSVKYRRLRGLLAAGAEEPNGLLTVGNAPALIPNVSAPSLVLREGLELRSQNRWPTLRFDVASLLQAGGGFFGAGFYYKTFMWPSWRFYEPIIRRLAGLGEAPAESALPAVAVEHLSCDVLVAGGGAAGLAAALSAARAGARVVVCEREPVLGGELEFETATIETRPAPEWVATTCAELIERGARILTDTALVGGSDGQLIAHAEPGGLPGANTLYRIRPSAAVLAMGAVERLIAFVDNDRPGVMLLGAAERYLSRYGVRAGEETVLFGCHDRLYASARRLMAGGLSVRAIVDVRSEAQFAGAGESAAMRAELMRAGVECLLGHAVSAAEGRPAVAGARVVPIAGSGSAQTIECDLLLVSGGWSPAVQAGLQDGASARYTPDAAAFIASGEPDWRMSAGAANGCLALGAALADGHAAGLRAARVARRAAAQDAAPAAAGDAPPRLYPYWRSPAPRSLEKRQFVDLQNDVTVADLRGALAEGFADIEHAKRYTTLGVGTEQGRTGAVLGAAILAELKGTTLAQVGTSRARPPFAPVTMRSLAGLRFGPAFRIARRTPLHDWHDAHGGVLESSGLWLRPRYYEANGVDAFAAGIAEAARVRSSGGIFDGSTLGKIEVLGSDAGAYLDTLYLTRASTIAVGRSKYMVNLREDGMVLDDGLVLRLAPDRFLVTTSSGHGEHMLSHFEHYRATGFGGRAVALTDVTDAWAVIAVAGPDSRDTLRAMLPADWSARIGALRHMDFVSGEYDGATLRVLRASFSGELAFELHCRPSIALGLWQTLADAGLPPYGLEAVDILRVEKGYLVGAELNGQTTPFDLGMEGLVAQGNPCVGRELLDRPAFHEASRPRLVGLRARDGRAQFLAGAQLTPTKRATQPVGYVTSAVYSPALDAWVGLGLLARDLAREGATVIARDPLREGDTALEVLPTVHVDPKGERMKA